MSRRRNAPQAGARWAALIVYGVLAAGIPIPLPAAATIDHAEPFPCMHHRCGCHSAEQCWRSCCCMSLSQKLAWARENGVKPPDYVLAEAKARRIAVENDRSAKADSCTCCCHCTPKANSEHEQAPAKNSQRLSKSSKLAPGVVLIEALGCQGADINWIGLTSSLPAPADVQWTPGTGLGERIVILSERRCGIDFPPSTPPPKSAVA